MTGCGLGRSMSSGVVRWWGMESVLRNEREMHSEGRAVGGRGGSRRRGEARELKEGKREM